MQTKLSVLKSEYNLQNEIVWHETKLLCGPQM